MPELRRKFELAHRNRPFTTAIDLTRGNLTDSLIAQELGIPCWTNFSVSRIREASKVELPTSGHTLSHNPAEIREVLEGHDLSHTLVLDDTAFSGNTSLMVEGLLRAAFPERKINFTHGFLILNNGQLGTGPGACQRLVASGSQVIEGMIMNTPQDDGWHIFDMVKQHNLRDHLQAVRELLTILGKDNSESHVAAFLSNESTLRTLLPDILTTEELHARQKLGHFVAAKALNGDFHARNPQMLPNVIGQRHLLKPEEWRTAQDEIFNLLERLGSLAGKGEKR